MDKSSIHVKPDSPFSEAVTDLDLKLSKHLLSCVRITLPESYSEEDLPEVPPSASRFWQIDPLDGTDELINGHPEQSGVSAALLQRLPDRTYQPIAGILYLPVREIMVIGNKSSESLILLRSGQKSSFSSPARSAIRGYVRGISPNDAVQDFYRQLSTKMNLPVQSIACGGAVDGFISLILGEINVLCFNYNYSKEWDVSAAQPIVELLGGFICDLDGNPFAYNKVDHFNHRGFLASISFSKNELLQGELKELLTEN